MSMSIACKKLLMNDNNSSGTPFDVLFIFEMIIPRPDSVIKDGDLSFLKTLQ